MFSFLKDKLKSAFSVFSKKAEETSAKETAEPQTSIPAPVPVLSEPTPAEIKPAETPAIPVIVSVPEIESEIKKIKKEIKPVISTIPPTQEQVVAAQEDAKKKGWFGAITEAITTRKLSEEQFTELFWDVELSMLENNVAVEVIEKIKEDLRKTVVGKALPRTKISDAVMQSLHSSLQSLFVDSNIDIASLAKKHKPLIVAFVGINGSGKTTTIAKVAKDLQKKGLNVVLAAADTFRAAAIDQLQLHADALGCKLVKHDYGADPAAVAFDAIEHAKAKGKDVVLIDTAGRLHSNTNLVDEMKKIIRVAKPHLKLFIGESITGNDCIEQARTFDEAIGIDGIILSKADIDEKGGAALSIGYVTKKPILYLGVGQTYDDLKVFDKNQLLAQIGV